MPLYDFKCDEGHVTELLRPVSVGAVPCPVCGGDAARQIGAAVVRANYAAIPSSEPEYQTESDKRDLKRRGWDYGRALEHIHGNIREDPRTGQKRLDTATANRGA